VGSIAVLLAMAGVLVGGASCFDAGSDPPPTQCECGLTPRCGTPCVATCGCCPTFGSQCLPEGIMKGSANGDCYEVIPCSGPNRCVMGAHGAVCAESTNDCEDVRAAYEAPLQSQLTTVVRSGDKPLPAGTYGSYCPEACKVSEGHCAQGLGTCWLLSSGPDAEQGRLAALYQALAVHQSHPANARPRLSRSVSTTAAAPPAPIKDRSRAPSNSVTMS
jgi:hypothetical protein